MRQINWSDPIFCVRYQTILYFVLSSRRKQKSREGEIKFGAHRTSHLPSISHLTSKPTHNASCHPARWRRWEDARALYRAQEAWTCCRLEAYVGGRYDVGYRRVRTGSYPPLRRKINPKSPLKNEAATP